MVTLAFFQYYLGKGGPNDKLSLKIFKLARITPKYRYIYIYISTNFLPKFWGEGGELRPSWALDTCPRPNMSSEIGYWTQAVSFLKSVYTGPFENSNGCTQKKLVESLRACLDHFFYHSISVTHHSSLIT